MAVLKKQGWLQSTRQERQSPAEGLILPMPIFLYPDGHAVSLLFKILFLFLIICLCLGCVNVWPQCLCTSGGPRRASVPLKFQAVASCILCSSWELISGPLPRWFVILIAEPSLLPCLPFNLPLTTGFFWPAGVSCCLAFSSCISCNPKHTEEREVGEDVGEF